MNAPHLSLSPSLMVAPTSLNATWGHASRVALQWRVLLLWTAAMLVPTALMVWPFWATLSSQLDHSVHAAALAHQLDAIALPDLMSKLLDNMAAVGQASAVALLLTLLLMPFLNGAIVACARSAQPLQWVALLQKGLHHYGRMLRLQVWALVPLGVVAGLVSAALKGVGKFSEQAVLESDAVMLGRLALVVAAVLLVLVHITLDAGRAQLVVYPGRTSAVKAWWRGCKVTRTRFLATLGYYLAFTALGLVLALGITALRVALPQVGAGWLVLTVVLAQSAVAAVGWMRIARLVALVDVAQARRDAGY